MNEMMQGGSMMWGMGFGSILILVLVVLAILGLTKYLFFSKGR